MALSAGLFRYQTSPSLGSLRSLASAGMVILDPAFTSRSMIFFSMRLMVFCWSSIMSTSEFPSSCPYTLTLFCRITGNMSGR